MKLAQLNAALLDLLSQGCDIQTIIDEGAKRIGEPLLVADTRFRILYMSATVDPQIERWQMAKESRYIADDILASMDKSNATQTLNNSPVPVQTILPNGYQAARCALRYRNTYRGFVGMYDYQHPFTQEDIDGLQSVCKAVNALLPWDSDLNAVDEDAYESLLFQLLRCSTENQAATVAEKHPSVTFGSQNQLAVICLSPGAKAPLRRVKELLRQYLYRHTSVILEDHLVLLMDSRKQDRQALENLELLAREHQFRVGLSFPFSRISWTPWAYRQGVFCLGSREVQPLLSFDTYLMDYVAQVCTKDCPASFYMHPIVTKIQEYDKVYHVNYLETLRAYIDSAGSLKATAAKLGVHYNTVKYRMSVIENVAGEPIRENGRLLAALYFSLLTHDCAEN